MMNDRIHIWVTTSELTIFLLGFENLTRSCSEQISQKLWGLISEIQSLAMVDETKSASHRRCRTC